MSAILNDKDIYSGKDNPLEGIIKGIEAVIKGQDILITSSRNAADSLAIFFKEASNLSKIDSSKLKAFNENQEKSVKIQKILSETELNRAKSVKLLAEAKAKEAKAESKSNEEKKETDKLNKQLVASEQKINRQGDDRLEQLEKNKRLITKANKVLKARIAIQNTEAGSNDNLRAKNALLTIQRNELTGETEEGRKAIEDLNSQLDENNEKIKENTDAFGKQKINIGNYTESINDAIGSTQGLSPALDSVVGGGNQLINVFKSIIANPIVGALTALVGLLGLVAKGYLSSAKGADELLKIQNRLNLQTDVLTSSAGNIGSAFVEAFKQSKNPIIALQSAIAAVGQNAVKSLADVNVAADAITEIQIKLRDTISQFASTQAELNKQLTQNNELVDDGTQSVNNRIDATQKSALIENKLAENALERSRAELSIIQITIKQREKLGLEVIELREKEAAAISQVNNDEVALLETQIKARQIIRDLNEEQLQRNLDFAIDNADSQLMANERIFNSDKATLQQRIDLIEQNKKLSQDSLINVVELLQNTTDKQINANELLKISDARLLQERIRGYELSDVNEGRLFEAIRERRIQVRDLADLEQEINIQRRELGDSIRDEEISAISDNFAQQATLEQENFNRVIRDAKINQEELFAIANDPSKSFTAAQEKQFEFLIKAQKNLNQRLIVLDNDRLQIRLDNQKSNLEESVNLEQQRIDRLNKRGVIGQIQANSKTLELTRMKYSEEERIEIESFAIRLQQLQGDQALIEQATFEHNIRLQQITENRINAENKAQKNQIQLFTNGLSQISTTAQNLLTQFSSFQQTITDNKLAALEEQKNKELENYQLTEEQRIVIEEDFDNQSREIEEAAFNRKKKLDTASALINGAVAITKAFSQTGVGGFIAAAGIAAVTALQVATIQQQEFYQGGEFSEKGGYTGNGNARNKSKSVGEKPYAYHKREFILNHDVYSKNKVTANMMHKGLLTDNDILPALDMSDNIPANSIYNTFDVKSLEKKMDTTNYLLNQFKYAVPKGAIVKQMNGNSERSLNA